MIREAALSRVTQMQLWPRKYFKYTNLAQRGAETDRGYRKREAKKTGSGKRRSVLDTLKDELRLLRLPLSSRRHRHLRANPTLKYFE